MDTVLWQIHLLSTSDGRFFCELTTGDEETTAQSEPTPNMGMALMEGGLLVLSLHPQLVQRQMQQQLTDIYSAITTETARDKRQEKRMAKKLAEITADIEKNAADQNALITKQTTVIDGVKVHLQGQAAVIAALKAQVQELIDAGGDPAQLAKLEELSAAMDAAEQQTTANTDALAAAIVANTEPK